MTSPVLDELFDYIGFTAEDADRLRALHPLLAPHFPAIADEFYEAIRKSSTAAAVLSGSAQVDRLAPRSWSIPGAGATATSYFRDELAYSGFGGGQMPEDLQDRVQQLTAEDAATRELVTVRPDATVEEIARTMLSQHIHRVLVIDDNGDLVGVISSFDLLRVVAKLDRPAPGPIRGTGYRR